ncbi:MAG: hypothetical protein QOI19_1388, partial [Thermoleophilaceae bacterium]|nr:hypothetical protein [Thermoleophilaceae bacterium]
FAALAEAETAAAEFDVALVTRLRRAGRE